MSLLEEITPSPRKVMTLFYLIDTSGSMGGSRIGTVNAAMEECIPLLKEVAAANDDAEIKVAILQFSSGCSWVTPVSGPVGLDDIIWNDLQAGGMTEFGGALLELDKKLSRNEYLNSQTGAYAPVILLLMWMKIHFRKLRWLMFQKNIRRDICLKILVKEEQKRPMDVH